ncbi:MAG: DUF5721 family protein [Lachnospiraceae bacterium]
MNAYFIQDLKLFTTHLFLKDTFDFFETGEVLIQTFTTFEISGSLNPDFYDSDERVSLQRSNCTWSQLRPFCLQMIKGKKLPLSFKITLFTAQRENQQFLQQLPASLQNSISRPSLTILYKNGTLSCVTGIAYSQFTMDRSAETLWSTLIANFLKKHQIAFTTID